MKDIRVVHVANRLNPGGVERWLLGIAQGLADSHIKLDLIVHSEQPGELEPAFLATGSNVIRCKFSKNPIIYAYRLFNILVKAPKYNAVHSHVHHFSGLILLISYFAGIKQRIAHSHSNRMDIEPKSGLRAWYLSVMKRLIKHFATDYIAVSQEASKSLYANLLPQKKIKTMYCGLPHLDNISFQPKMREQLGIDGMCVIGHVGRLSEPKNHSFILKIFSAVLKLQPAKLLLVGDGECRQKIEHEIRSLNLQDNVILLGMRNDAPDIMASVFDVMVFPSLYEGLPLTVVEAQVAGIPTIVASNITREAEFDSKLVSYMSLENSPQQWASALIKKAKMPKTSDLEKYKQTGFYFPKHLEILKDLYH